MRVAIVSPGIGDHLTSHDGIAASLVRQFLDADDDVTVFTDTTTAPGESSVDGVKIDRFHSDRSQRARYEGLLARLPQGLSEREADELVAASLNATPLLTNLARRIDEFDAIVFIAHFNGIVLRGWRIAPDRTTIVASYDDTALFAMPHVATMFNGARNVIFPSDTMRDEARHLHGPGVLARSVVVDDFARARAAIITLSAIGRRAPTTTGNVRIVHWLLRAEYGDSQTLLAIQLDKLLRESGYRSCIAAAVRGEIFGTTLLEPLEALEAGAIALPYDKHVDGTRALVTDGDGPAILDEAGERRVLPLFVDYEAWKIEPARNVLLPLSDGKTNLLALAALAPQNHVIELVEIFRLYRTFDASARLIVVGDELDAAYATLLRSYIAHCGLADAVRLTGTISRPALAAMYRSARTFVSLRDRYDTGLSLLEAMAFDVPVCVRDVAGARATTAGKSVLFSGISKPIELAALWRSLTRDGPFRDRVLALQRSHLTLLTPENTLRSIESAIGSDLEAARV